MTWQTYPIKGFAPDANPGVGIISSSSQIVPTVRGIGSGSSTTAVGSTFTGPSCGGAKVIRLDGSARYFIGTATKLYELVGSTPTDRSGTAYSAATSQLWSFSQLGDITLAVNKGNALQQISSGSAFAAISGAPKASIVVVAGEPNLSFVMLFNYDDGVNNYTDGIYWTPTYTDWTASIATQVGNVRITDISGSWTAAVPYRNGVLAFKYGAMYHGTYVGGAAMWAWERISDRIGCIGKNAVCAVGDVVYFADANGLWVYDGSYPRPMPGEINYWWTQQTHSQNEGVASSYERLTWIPTTRQLWVSYGYPSLTNPLYIVFNTTSGLWTQYGELTNSNGSAAAEYLVDFAVQSGSTTRFLAASGASLAATVKLGTFGDMNGTTQINGVRGYFPTGPSDSDTTWLSGKLWHGPSIRNVEVATYIPMTIRAPSEVDGQIQDRFIRPELDFLAGNTWEMTAFSCNLLYTKDAE